METSVNAQRVIDFMAAQIGEQAKTIATLQTRNEFLEAQLRSLEIQNRANEG